MKARLLILTVAILGGFYFVTTHTFSTGAGNGWFTRAASTSSPQKTAPLPGGMQITDAHAAQALLPSEQNNIAVYKKALPSVVNITSSMVTYDFFYGAVPEQGQGSGFILNKKGDILTNFHVVSNGQNVEVTLSNKHQN